MGDPDVRDLMTVVQAIATIDAVPVAVHTQNVSLDEAQGLLLADDLMADRDYAPFDKSQMDGVACR